MLMNITPHSIANWHLFVPGLYFTSQIDEGVRRASVWARYVRKLRDSRHSDMPTIVWRESTPQHFNTSDGVFPSGVEPGGGTGMMLPELRCASRLNRGGNQLNERINSIVRQNSIQVMSVWEEGMSRGDDHVGRYLSIDQGTLVEDCTHFCEPSVYVSILAHKVVTLLAQAKVLKPVPIPQVMLSTLCIVVGLLWIWMTGFVRPKVYQR